MDLDPSNSFNQDEMYSSVVRYELKASTLSVNLSRSIRRLLELGFKRQFADRLIYSVYLDSADLELYRQSEEGITPRKKFRYRSYDDFKQSVNFEVKLTEAYGRRKLIYRDKTYDPSLLHQFDGLRLKPMLKTIYRRSYFFYDDVRVTVDSDIRFERPDYLLHSVSVPDNSVIEFKGDNEAICMQVIFSLGLQVTRFSKYCAGIKLTY